MRPYDMVIKRRCEKFLHFVPWWNSMKRSICTLSGYTSNITPSDNIIIYSTAHNVIVFPREEKVLFDVQIKVAVSNLLVHVWNCVHPTVCIDSYFAVKLCSSWYRPRFSIKSNRFSLYFFLPFFLPCFFIFIWFFFSFLSIQFTLFIWNFVTLCNTLKARINSIMHLLLLLLLCN
jgi:hypothetical protein